MMVKERAQRKDQSIQMRFSSWREGQDKLHKEEERSVQTNMQLLGGGILDFIRGTLLEGKSEVAFLVK